MKDAAAADIRGYDAARDATVKGAEAPDDKRAQHIADLHKTEADADRRLRELRDVIETAEGQLPALRGDDQDEQLAHIRQLRDELPALIQEGAQATQQIGLLQGAVRTQVEQANREADQKRVARLAKLKADSAEAERLIGLARAAEVRRSEDRIADIEIAAQQERLRLAGHGPEAEAIGRARDLQRQQSQAGRDALTEAHEHPEDRAAIAIRFIREVLANRVRADQAAAQSVIDTTRKQQDAEQQLAAARIAGLKDEATFLSAAKRLDVERLEIAGEFARRRREAEDLIRNPDATADQRATAKHQLDELPALQQAREAQAAARAAHGEQDRQGGIASDLLQTQVGLYQKEASLGEGALKVDAERLTILGDYAKERERLNGLLRDENGLSDEQKNLVRGQIIATGQLRDEQLARLAQGESPANRPTLNASRFLQGTAQNEVARGIKLNEDQLAAQRRTATAIEKLVALASQDAPEPASIFGP